MIWQPMSTAPRDGYCLGFDPHLKRAFVMLWSPSESRFIVSLGFGDETPVAWLPLPVAPSETMTPAVETRRLEDRLAELRKETFRIRARIAALCEHDWRWHPAAGEELYCLKCSARNFDVDD